MSRSTLVQVLIQAALTAGAALMCVRARFPWAGALGVVLLGVSAIAATMTPTISQSRFWRYGTAAAWVCTLVLPGTLLWAPDSSFTVESFWDQYYAVLAWLIAAPIFSASYLRADDGLKAPWGARLMVCAFFGDFLCLGTAFSHNHTVPFYFGLIMGLALLILCKLRFRLPAPAILGVNTLILVLIGLPLADLALYRLRPETTDPQILKKYYSFRAALKDLRAFERWSNYFDEQVLEMQRKLLIQNSADPVPIRLRPNSHAMLVQSQISVNSRGFRGREISESKGENYRIVVLGESTTFGLTINPEDKPWPELLEQVIAERLKPDRPIEVINAGIPSITMPENLNRLPDEILPLKPDMIICYHGINGFCLLDKAIPPLRGEPVPPYRERPVRILGECEYRLKLLAYKQALAAKESPQPPSFSNLLDTDYARAYRRLIGIARTNDIRLVVANFPLAANPQSAPELVEFFSRRQRRVDWQIQANVAHGLMVEQLVREHPQLCFVNTRPHLDGDEQKYIDLMHLTQDGERQLAETFFAGIRTGLEADLNSKRRAQK